jgi:hypothetical protein
MFAEYLKALGTGPIVSPELADRVRELWAALAIDPACEPTCGPSEDSAFSIGLRSGSIRLWVEIEFVDPPYTWVIMGHADGTASGYCYTIEELVEQLAPYLPMFAK